MIKKILLFIIIFISFIYNSIIEVSANESTANDKLDVIALIKWTDWTYYNYLFLTLKKDNQIICSGFTRQYFTEIGTLPSWVKTDIKKLSDNWLMKIKCDKNKLLKNWKLDPNIKLQIVSDWFYNINNWELVLNPNSLTIKNNMVFIGDLKSIRANFKIKIEKINYVLFNKYSRNYKEIKEKLKRQEERKKHLKKLDKNLKEVIFKITNIPKDIKEIKYQYNNIKYIYDPKKENKFLVDKDVIDYIKIGEKKFYNLKITNNELIIPYDKDFNKKPIELTFKIKNLPKIYKDLNIYIDWKYFDFKKHKKYIVNQQQLRNWIRIKIWDKEKVFKITKSDEIELDYNYFVKDNIVENIEWKEQLKIPDNYLAIKLPLETLDWLWRISYKVITDNGAIKKKTILKKDIFIDSEKKELIITKFIGLKDELPNEIIIKWKKYKIKDVAINYDKFLKLKYD